MISRVRQERSRYKIDLVYTKYNDTNTSGDSAGFSCKASSFNYSSFVPLSLHNYTHRHASEMGVDFSPQPGPPHYITHIFALLKCSSTILTHTTFLSYNSQQLWRLRTAPLCMLTL